MATDYDIEISDDTGTVRLSGTANFPDPNNAPAPPGSPSPFKPAMGDDVVVLETSTGAPLIHGGDAANGAVFQSQDGNSAAIIENSGILLTSTVGVSVGSTGDLAGFFGAAPIVRPVVPLTTPLPQDIIDALVALGLVSQSD